MNDETLNIAQSEETLNETETNPIAGETPVAEETKQEEVQTEATLFEAVEVTTEEISAEPAQNLESINENIPATEAEVILDAPVVEPDVEIPAILTEVPAVETDQPLVATETEVVGTAPVVEAEAPVVETAPVVEAEAPVAETAPVVEAEAPVAETAPVVEATEEVKEVSESAEPAGAVAVPVHAEEVEKAEKAKKEKVKMQEKYDAVYQELVALKETDSIIEVEIKGRIRGGLRAIYKDMPLFLPASHYSLKRTPTEQEMTEAIGKHLSVNIHELQEYDEGRKAVIVSRKNILITEFWNKININDHVEGKVSSIAPFGVFLDLGGVEGLIHISRLSQIHVDDPNKFLKKGDMVKAVVVEIDKSRNRIALDRKALEDSPWKGTEELYLAGTQHTGIVRRLTDFGAYVELKPGVDGLLRTPEISWTKRVKRPSDVLKAGQEIVVEIISVSEEKQTVSLSFKKTQPNPWANLVDKYPVGTEYDAKVLQVMPQGCIISLNDEIDGFMPRSKMKNILQGNKIPYHPGDSINVLIADLIPEEESLILSPVVDESAIKPEHKREDSHRHQSKESQKADAQAQREGITFGDYLSEIDKKSLFNTLGE